MRRIISRFMDWLRRVDAYAQTGPNLREIVAQGLRDFRALWRRFIREIKGIR